MRNVTPAPERRRSRAKLGHAHIDGLIRPDARAGAAVDLVIPALNEERRIAPTIAKLARTVVQYSLPVRIIVVDNGSVDSTVEVVSSQRDLGVPVEIINCRVRGKGAAVRAGVRHSTAPRVGFCDADLPVAAESLNTVFALLDAGWEIVIGSRRCQGATYAVPQPTLRRLGGTLFRALSKDLRGPVRDTQCGFKFFTSALARQIFSDSHVNGFAFDLEIIARAQQLGARLIELPVTWSDQDGSSFRTVTDGIQSIVDLRSTRRRLRTEPQPGAFSPPVLGPARR